MGKDYGISQSRKMKEVCRQVAQLFGEFLVDELLEQERAEKERLEIQLITYRTSLRAHGYKVCAEERHLLPERESSCTLCALSSV